MSVEIKYNLVCGGLVTRPLSEGQLVNVHEARRGAVGWMAWTTGDLVLPHPGQRGREECDEKRAVFVRRAQMERKEENREVKRVKKVGVVMAWRKIRSARFQVDI